jgi:hypothetical protein
MGAPTQWDYEKLRKDADRLVMLLADPHPDLATWGVVLESVMSRLVEVAPTPVLSRELLRRHPAAFPPGFGSAPGDLAVEAEPRYPGDPTSVKVAAEMNAWLRENREAVTRLIRKDLTDAFSRWLAGKDDGSSCDSPPSVGSEPRE